ncbi:hypothetical protein [Sphingomonas sp.]|jgi:hypothetical protein|uniref:hypothetical protein n=1 Tax=Sphingomonas sp. TaxID=28214 RepID=UPI002ED843FB
MTRQIMATRRKQPTKPHTRNLGVNLLSAGAAAIGVGAALIAILLRRPPAKPEGVVSDAADPATAAPSNPAEHAVPDLAPDAPPPGPHSRAPDAFRPDPTAPVPPELRESLRPATGPAPSLAADRGSAFADAQDSA